MREWLIFHYKIDGQEYVDSYPIHEEMRGTIMAAALLGGTVTVDGFGLVSSPSRNQARRSAYINWVDSSGKGFDKWPYRAYSKSGQG